MCRQPGVAPPPGSPPPLAHSKAKNKQTTKHLSHQSLLGVPGCAWVCLGVPGCAWVLGTARCSLAALNALCFGRLLLAVHRGCGKGVMTLTALITAVQFHFSFYMSRTLPNTFAMPFGTCAHASLYSCSPLLLFLHSQLPHKQTDFFLLCPPPISFSCILSRLPPLLQCCLLVPFGWRSGLAC